MVSPITLDNFKQALQLNESFSPKDSKEYDAIIDQLLKDCTIINNNEECKKLIHYSLIHVRASFSIREKCTKLFQQIFPHEKFLTLNFKEKTLNTTFDFLKEKSRYLYHFASFDNSNSLDLSSLLDSELNLEPTTKQTIAEDDINIFLKFIETDEVEINQNNVFHLINLARHLQSESLEKRCADFFTKSNFNWTLVENLDLIFSCCLGLPPAPHIFEKYLQILISKFQYEEDSVLKFHECFEQVLNDNVKIRSFIQSLEDVIAFIAFDKTKKELYLELRDMDISYLNKLFLTFKENLKSLIPDQDVHLNINSIIFSKNDSNFDFLLELIKNNKNINHIELYADSITKEDLEKLAEYPNITSLIINGSSLTEFPTKLMTQLNKLRCSNCNNLQVISSLAESVDIYDCSKIKKVTFPNVKTLSISGCPIEEVEGNAENVYLGNCRNLRTINLPNVEELKVYCCPIKEIKSHAKVVDIDYCYELQELDLPLAKSIKVSQCPLKELNSNAERVVILGCKSINKISLPFAQTIAITGSPLIEELENNAEIITIRHCDLLKKVNFPRAKTLYIENCPVEELESFATEISINDCQKLKKFNFPNVETFHVYEWHLEELESHAKNVFLFDSHKLKRINFPNAEIFGVESCSFEECETNAKIIDIICCHNLKKVYIPNVETLTIAQCDLLKELNVNAKDVTIRYCQSLKNVNIPIAERIAFINLSAIEIFNGNVVKNAYIYRCENLKRVNFPVIEILSIESCPVEELSGNANTQIVTIDDCSKIRTINFIDAEELNISRLNFITELITNAKRISIKNCLSLRKVKFQNPEKVDIQGCDRLII